MPDRRGAVLAAFLLATVLVTLGGCANGPGPATSTPTPVATTVPSPPPSAQVSPPSRTRVTGVDVSMELEPTTQRAFEDAQIEIRTEEPTLGQLPGWKDGSDTLHLPITGGEVDLTSVPPRGRVRTDGTAMLGRGGTSVGFADLVVDLDGQHLTGTVDGRPITVADLDLSRAHVEALPALPPSVVGVTAQLSDEARREIRDRLGADLTPDTARVDLELRLRAS